MKFKHQNKKYFFAIATALTTLAVGISIATNLGSKALKVSQTTSPTSKIDPTQARIQKYMNAGKGAIVVNNVGGGLNSRLSRASLDLSDGTDLSSYVGEDIAKISLGNIFSNGGADSTSGSVFHQEARPNTGVIVVSTNVTNTASNVKANAYDYVNLKYVQYNKTTGALIDVLSAPPPGLFTNNLWPTWTTSTATPVDDDESTINLSALFPTASILDGVKKTFGFTSDTVSKKQWFEKTNSNAFTLDLSSLFINSVAELFNPNLVWGFGIYDLHTQVISVLNGTKSSDAGNEILYKGLYKIVVNDNALDYFPNPQFNNMPALRYIQATKNQIKAVGDFASYDNGDLNAKSIAEGSSPSYFLYLKSLWDADSTKNYPSIIAIKKWLTETLPSQNRFSNSTGGSTARGSIDDQLSFQVAISANNIFFPDNDGNVLKNKQKTSWSIPNESTGSWGDLNFASVILNVSKNFYEIDFSSNQIQRVHVTPTKFTYINFSSNQLKYVPPLALEPLPWNYLATAVELNRPRQSPSGVYKLNTTQWSTNYNNSNSKSTSQATQTNSFPITQKLIAPTLQFSNNQILDFWPNNTKADGATNDGWYTWPNTTSTAPEGEPPVASSLASTRAQAPSPYNRSTWSSASYSAYLHRNFLTARPEGTEYNESSANLLGDWKNSGFTDRNDANFYRYYFASLADNVELISQQNFTTQLNFNLFGDETSKQKPFVLPGYETSGDKMNTSVTTFNQGLKSSTSTSASKTVDRYYDNLVPYLLGRTLPQNRTTAETWNSKNLNVKLTGDSGANLLSEFATLNSAAVFTALSSGSFTADNSATNFVKQILGALPYGNGIYNNKATGNTNVATGIPVAKFNNQARVTLSIQQPDLGLNYNYVINVLKNLNYTAEAKNPKESDNKTENIAASSFTKKTNFALATSISATDLLNETDAWLKASDYVKIYLENNPSALTITNYDIAKGQITVRFNINDVNGAPVNLMGLDDNTMVLTGFTSLNGSFVSDEGKTIATGDNGELDKLTNHFLPKNVDEVRTWIKNHYQVNWLGLELAGDGGMTAGVSEGHPNGYYKLSELKTDYITNLNVQANSGAISFTVIIPATAANDNVPLSRSYSLTSFLKFGMNINTSSYNKTSKQAVYDYQQNPELLKKFVELAPTRTLNDGNTSTATAMPWIKTDATTAQTDAELQTANLIPKYGTLKAVINASSDQAAGILNFDVSLLDNSNPSSMPLPVISTQSKTLTGLYNYDSQFSLNGSSTVGSTGVRYISDEAKSSSTASQLNDVLKGYAAASNQDNFRTWIEPLIDFSKSDQTYNIPAGATEGTWTPSALNAEEKKQLTYGFGTDVTLTANDITNNVSFDVNSNTLSINNLYLKGGYLNGHFYKGTETDAPVTSLGSSVYSFFGQTTKSFNFGSFNSTTSPVTSEKWNGKTYQGANTYFQDALTKWKEMLPSEWAARLLSLKNANRENTVNAETYQVQNYDTLFSFLNHVVNTSTSNLLYKTRVDINDVTKIEVNDFAGLITIPANILLIYNNYGSDATSSPDALNAQPKMYDKEIKFQLSDYKTRLSDEVKNALPWKLEPAVNAQFQAVEGNVVQSNLTQLLTAAKKLYTNSDLAGNDQSAALTAIQILASNFIADEYYTQPNANTFFTHKFGSLGPDDKANEYTQFENITYQDLDTLNGTMKVTVTLKNYITGYNTTTNKYTLEDKTKQFPLTNLLRQFATPIWNSDTSQTTTPQIMNLATTAPELRLFEPGTDNPIFSYQTVSRTAFHDLTAEAYYNELVTNPANQSGEYIKIGPDGSQFANWSIVDNYGISPAVIDSAQLKVLTDKLGHAEIVIKKSNIHFSSRTNQIYFIDPVIHFTGTYNDLAAKQAAMVNIFDPLRNSPGHIPFGADQNFQTNSLTNITLTGFAKVPTQISLKTNVTKIQLGAQTFNQNEVLPSQIYDWIQNNYSNSTQLYNLFMSFYNLIGTSDLKNPLTISLNPAIVAVLNQANGSKDLSSWITFNDGFGTISFKDVFFISNTFSDKNQSAPTPTLSPITDFMVANSHDQFSLSDLKKSSFEKVEANQVVQAQISSNITTAMNELEQNNFRLAHQLLMVNEIKTNLVNDESQLEINNVTSNLQSGELLIHYTVRNTYANGQRTNMSGVYVLSNFHSPIVPFLQAGLAPLLIGFSALVLGVYFINRRYRNNMNTRKYTKKKIANAQKKG